MNPSLINIIGVSASICTAISLLPQLFKIYREKKRGDTSLLMLGVLFLGNGLWVLYGTQKNDWIIICSNAFSVMVNIVLSLLLIKYKSK